MLQVVPILFPEVTDQLNDNRFDGLVEGCVVMQDANYLGHVLFRQDGKNIKILDSSVKDENILDFAIRACLARCQRQGALFFHVNELHPPLQAFWQSHVCSEDTFYNIETLLKHNTSCCHCKQNP